MLNQDNQIQNLFAQSPLDNHIDLEHRNRLEHQLLETFAHQREQAAQPPLPTWHRLAKYAVRFWPGFATAAAALLVLGAVLLMSSPRAFALGQTLDALKHIRFIHVVMTNESAGVKDERWIEIGPDGQQLRYRQHTVAAGQNLVIIDDGQRCLSYEADKNSAILSASDGQRYQWIGNLQQFFQKMMHDTNLVLESNLELDGRKQHHVWWPQAALDCYIDATTKLPTQVGPWQVSYEAPGPGTFECTPPAGAIVLDEKTAPADLAINQSAQAAELFEQARQCLVRQEYESARALLEKVVSAEPDMNWAWFWLGTANDKLGNTTAAIDAYTRVIEILAPLKVTPHYCHLERGLAYRKTGNHAAARQDLAIALPAMIQSLKQPEGTEPFDYADNPLWKKSKQQAAPSQEQLFQRMIERLQEAAGTTVTPASPTQASIAEAWQKWWAEHAADYGVTSPNP